MNDFIDDVDTTILPSRDLQYTSAEVFQSRMMPDTAKESSTVPTVSSSEMQGRISVRTIPTSAQNAVNEKPITLL